MSVFTDDTPQIVPLDPSTQAEATADVQQPADQASLNEGTLQEPGADTQDPESSGFQASERSTPVQELTHSVPQDSQVLHVCLGPLPDAHASCKAFYFLRDEPGKVAPEDMETHIECGVLSEGPSLRMLQQVSVSCVDQVSVSRTKCGNPSQPVQTGHCTPSLD